MPASSSPPAGFVRRILGWAGRLLLILYFAAGLLILVGRHVLMPQLAGQQALLERELSAAIGLPVKVAAMSAEWPGLHPRLALRGLQIHDRDGRPALHLDHVEAEIGWSSLLILDLRLHRLEIAAPQLDIRRDAAGAIQIAGLPLVTTGEEGGFARWLLAQGRIVVRDARVTWHDELRGAAPFSLTQLNIELRNFGRYHSFGIHAEPAVAAATRLDLRGNLVGNDVADLADWRGELYADVTAADLAEWQTWIDLPPEWSRGHGDVRLWLNFADRQITELTGELRLADVVLKLRTDLPELALARLSGRLDGQRTGDGYVARTHRLTLTTQEGVVLPPTDARLEWQPAGRKAGGEFSANTLDIGTLAALAGHLPLPAQAHERLREFAPRGRLAEVAVQWKGTADAPDDWQARMRFDGLALAAYRELPGVDGLSGRFEGDARSGDVHIDSRDLRIALPKVFPDPVLAFAGFEADAGWTVREGAIDVRLVRAAFRNKDAHGEAAGTYRHTGQGPGEIDLSAKLTNAAGKAVWRYMPLVVNQDARDWLRAAILGGMSDSTTLRLKGPLEQFPFRDGKGGIFQVKGTIRGASLDFAPGWPRMTGIDGELLFEGVRMTIRGRRANIMGVALSDVVAEIPDLDADEEMLIVNGRARGETRRFLDFIEASPVGERIDHFTQPMSAEGRGELALKLTMPLRHVVDTDVQGSYRFSDNRIRVLPELPPLTSAQGEFGFTTDRLQARGLRAQLYGAPLELDVGTGAGGAVRVEATGTLPMAFLREQPELAGWRLFDHLSGAVPWRAVVTVKKPAAEVQVDARFDAVSSSLPEPFNKSAGTPLTLKANGRIEERRNRWAMDLGQLARLQVQQAATGWRGRIALGDAVRQPVAALPERGLALNASVAELDVDRWRTLLAGPATGSATNGSTAPPPLPLTGVKIRSERVRLQQRDFHGVILDGLQANGRWRFALDSREVRGQVDWTPAGADYIAGRIAGRFAYLALPAADEEAHVAGEDRTIDIEELPDVELTIDDFRLRDMQLGSVRVAAENRSGSWQARVEAKNDVASLTGTGAWRPSRAAPETAFDFQLAVDDAEKLLTRVGMPDAVRRGNGRITGSLRWTGAPFGLDLASLSGQMTAEIGKGQFKKLEPGVGRLLGVLSLQSLPRRITLDFRDIFSEGFAFDSIVGNASIDRGVMQTEDLRIRGAAALIDLSGRVNLLGETQDLRVRVQPSVGDTLATGAMLANPVAGAVVWLAQKALNDPLGQAFAYEYAVTGPWSDPQVEKIKRNVDTRATP